MAFDNERATRLNYIIALYDNTLTVELRDAVKSQITSIDDAMEILGEIVSVFKQAILDHKIETTDAIQALGVEYTFLDLNKFLDYKYVHNLVILNFYLCRPVGYNTFEIYEFMNEIISYADEAPLLGLKTDIYCAMIRVLDTYNAVINNLELTHKVLDYYNELPEEERKITILPKSLVAF